MGRLSGARLAAAVIVLWYVVVILLWAVRPLSGFVQVGTDYSGPAPRAVSVEIECDSLFSSHLDLRGALPDFPQQPEDRPPLVLPAEPCAFLRSDARRALAIDTLTLVGALGACVAVSRVSRRDRHTRSGGAHALAAS